MRDLRYWIALEQVKGVGPAHLREVHDILEEQNLQLTDLMECTPEEIHSEFHFNEQLVQAIVEARKPGEDLAELYSGLIEREIAIIPLFSDLYPQLVHKRLGNNIPPFLYCLGNSDLLNETGIALLGERDISPRGEVTTLFASRELVRHNIAVISGYAAGAGMMAHRTALEQGGKTVAVIPSGILHFKLADSLKEVFDLERILIVSPFFPEAEANKFNAFMRNRFICALSAAVYVIEAPEREGIFEAAKSAHKLEVPLYTTEYSSYPASAEANKRILAELNGRAVRARLENDMLVPNMDGVIAHARF